MTETSSAQNEWSRYWAGRASGVEGPSREGLGFAADAGLEAFWRDVISEWPKTAMIADLACGDGALIAHAYQMGYQDLTGIDVAQGAIDLVQAKYPGVKGIVSPIEALDAESAQFDLMISQFGFEYAGAQSCLPAIAEMIRPGGRFCAVVHMAEGEIARECRGHLKACRDLDDTGYLPAAIEAFKALFLAESTGTAEANEALVERLKVMAEARSQIVALMNDGHAMARQALTGAETMFQRRRNYLLEDITGWLEKLVEENAAHAERMTGMLEAALSEGDAKDFLFGLEAKGFVVREAEILKQGAQNAPVGWILNAQRPA